MYKITNVTDRDGNVKEVFMQKMKQSHPSMCGELLFSGWMEIGSRLCLVWDDNSNKMLRTSPIVDDVIREEGKIIVTTMNSIYTLEKCGG